MNNIMSAFRFAKLHKIPVIVVPKKQKLPIDIEISWKKIDFGLALNHKMSQEVKSYLEWYGLDEHACINNSSSGESVIGFTSFKSQLIKNLAIWHELGHYIDCRQRGYQRFTNTPILKREARASALAIKLMKKYGQWKDKYLDKLLQWYDTYERDYCSEKSYRHLIIREGNR